MHRFRALKTTTAALICICLASAGCTTTRLVPVPRAGSEILTSDIKPGSKVVVTLRSGEKQTFRLTAIGADSLIGKDVRIPFADIALLQERKISTGRTLGLVAGTLVVMVGAFFLHVMHEAEDDD